jgi:prepilin peptidase CpaA
MVNDRTRNFTHVRSLHSPVLGCLSFGAAAPGLADRRKVPLAAMTFQPQTILLTVFAVLMAAAAFEDFRRLTIPNLVPAALCLLWPAYALATAPSLYDVLTAAGCGLAVFLVGAVMFARGWLGGGDVKLLAAATLWAGPAGTPTLLVTTSVLGGVMALFLLMPFGSQLAASARLMLGQIPLDHQIGSGVPVPYGIAIAGAALIVILPPLFG